MNRSSKQVMKRGKTNNFVNVENVEITMEEILKIKDDIMNGERRGMNLEGGLTRLRNELEEEKSWN